ncbi:hypothetical protein ACIOJ9_34575 [Streptomyces sp. NPDC088175]|uniref:hypothetical protein n=1 Tax=unclassified Streptomyces TaxID=2593676 RepID=UPI0038209AD7
MEHDNPLDELSSCIDRHNKASRSARELWATAEEEGRRIGRLAGALLAEGIAAAEVGHLLIAVDDTSDMPAGLTSTEAASRPDAPTCPSGTDEEDNEQPHGRVPPQRNDSAHQPPAEKTCNRTRAREIVRSVRWPSGITVGTLMRVLAAEGRTTTEEQVQDWLKEWSTSGEIMLVGAGRYLHTAQAAHGPTLATGEHAPLLLRRAYQIVSGTPRKEMSTRDLAAGLKENVNVVGGELCAMLREVDVIRPNRGKVTARYGEGDGPKGPRMPGYTAETLGQAICAYNERGTTSKNSSPTHEQVALPTDADGSRSETARERALEIIEAAGVVGINHATLVHRLGKEHYTVVDAQVHTWLTHWTDTDVLRRIGDDSYVQAGLSAAPSLASGLDSVPDLLIRAHDVACRFDQQVVSSQSLFAALQQETPVFRDASDMAGRLVRILTLVGVTRPEKGLIRPHPRRPRVLGFKAVTLQQAITAYQAQPSRV